MKQLIIFFTLIFSLISCEEIDEFREQQESRLILGTFNIEWLGDGINDLVKRNEEDYKRIAEIIENTNADILGLEEIENETALKRVLKYLPNYKFIIGKTGSKQNPAVIYKENIEVDFVEDYEPLSVEKGKTRAGLIVNARKGNFDWLMMVVHLKATSKYDSTDELRAKSYELRTKQAKVLSYWVDSLEKYSKEKDIIIVGDFNDNPKRTRLHNLQSLVEKSKMTFLTKELKSCKNHLWDNIDHIAVNNSARERFLINSLFVYNIYDEFNDYEVDKISDHCPVLAAFDILAQDND